MQIDYILGPFLAACQFLTVLPIRYHVPGRALERSISWFPVVGTLLGLALAGIDRAAQLVLAPPVVNALLVAANVGFTGSLHLDGLIDSVNGLRAGPDRQARLAVMRESIASPPGAIACCWLLIAMYASLTSLPTSIRFVTLVLAPTLGRAMILLAYWLFPYSRPGPSPTASLKRGATGLGAFAGCAAALTVVCGLAGIRGLPLVLIVLAIMLTTSSLALLRISGLTGDVYGAICALSELAVLAAAPGVLSR